MLSKEDWEEFKKTDTKFKHYAEQRAGELRSPYKLLGRESSTEDTLSFDGGEDLGTRTIVQHDVVDIPPNSSGLETVESTI